MRAAGALRRASAAWELFLGGVFARILFLHLATRNGDATSAVMQHPGGGLPGAARRTRRVGRGDPQHVAGEAPTVFSPLLKSTSFWESAIRG